MYGGGYGLNVIEQLRRRWFLFGALVIFIIGILVLAYLYAVDSPFRLHANQARADIVKGKFKTVLDVRTDLEYWAGHYPGAVHIPTAKLLEEAYNTLPNLDEYILIYCNTGQRARHATEVLRALGYKNVFYVASPYWALL
jgi:phage shock protein E